MVKATDGSEVILVLRGIKGHFAGRDWPRGALDEPSAIEYVQRRGYTAEVLDVAGKTGEQSPQTMMAIRRIEDSSLPPVVGLYGFSGGGYNVLHILDDLTSVMRAQIKLVIVLGAPGNPMARYKGPWELVYRVDPPESQGGHMGGPKALLA